LTLVFPANAVAVATPITLDYQDTYPASTEFVANTCYSFAPTGTQFQQPVQTTIKYSAADIPAGVDEATLGLYKVVGAGWEAVADSAVDTVGKTVTAHCHATQAIINATEAGVDVIEHCSFMGPDGRGGVRHEFREDVAEEIVKKGIWVDNLLNPRQENYGRVKNSFENFRGFRKLNAKILPGTDGLKPLQTGLMPLALEMWVKGGASPMEALMAATSISAEAIGLGDLIGTIEPGKEADLVVVGSDPLENIIALRDPRMIVKGGKVVPPSMQVEAKGELARLASGFSAAFT